MRTDRMHRRRWLAVGISSWMILAFCAVHRSVLAQDKFQDNALPSQTVSSPLMSEFERAWIETHMRVAPVHRLLVRKTIKKRQRTQTARRHVILDQRLGR